MVKRRVGLQAPFSEDQIVSWVAYPLLVCSYFLAVGLCLGSLSYQVHLIWVQCVLTVLFLTAYYVVETTDPAEYTDGVNIPVVCFPKATEKTRYCAQCGKSVVGLDHHCTWLNTCIGIQNYVPFISLVTIGFTQMSMQVTIGALLLSPVFHDAAHKEWTTERLHEPFVYYILIGAYLLGSLVMLLSFGILLVFHLYLLLWVRVGTYEWMMGGRVEYNGRNQTNTEDKLEQENKKKRERFEAARQAALKEATVADVAQSSQRKPQGDAGAPRTRGYDRLTVFPAGDRELELTAADHVSDISIHGVGRQESV